MQKRALNGEGVALFFLVVLPTLLVLTTLVLTLWSMATCEYYWPVYC